MKSRGEHLFIIFLLVFLVSFSVKAETTHENFIYADIDLSSIVSFFDDSLVLCEDIVNYSILSNCSIKFSEKIQLNFSNENLENSFNKLNDLQKKLDYSEGITEKIKNKASSSIFLKEYLTDFKNLSIYISNLSYKHENIITNFSAIINYTNTTKYESNAALSLSNLKSLITESKIIIQNLESAFKGLEKSFTIIKLRKMILEFSNILIKYEKYIDDFFKIINIEKPFLFLNVKSTNLYLGDDVNVYGYFLADNAFVSNQTIDIFWKNKKIKNAKTDNLGRFDFNFSIIYETRPGAHNLSLSTIYNLTYYRSNNLTLLIRKIPTKILISIPKNDFYINESIIFSGRLEDHKSRGIKAPIFLIINGKNISIISDDKGNFIYEFNDNHSFGLYQAFVHFNPLQIYEPIKSKIIEFKINTPTTLKIDITKRELFIDESISIQGFLISKIDNIPLSNRYVDIIFNSRKISSVLTDKNGTYEYKIETSNLNEGKYTISSIFLSDDSQWRSSYSDQLEIHLQYKSNLFLLFLPFLFVIIVCILIYLIRKKILYVFKNRKIPFIGDSVKITEKLKKDKSKIIKINIDDFIIDKKIKKKEQIKDSIIENYQSFLTILFKKGFICSRGFTHLDIRNQMLHHGFTKKPTNIITKAFEYAMYSPYSLDNTDLILFNKSMLIILKKLGEMT